MIAPNTKLVSLDWTTEWSIIATDPLRLVQSQQLLPSEGTCPLHTYPLDGFNHVPGLFPAGSRLLQQISSEVARPLIMGRLYTIADSIGVVAKATFSLHPQPGLTKSEASVDWMPALSQTWFAELNVPIETFAPIVNDNAFLDFAECYLSDKPELLRGEQALQNPKPKVHFVQLPNGQHAVVNKRGLAQDESPRLDALMCEIDRDILHFGIVAAARLIRDPLTESEVVLSKRYFGLESALLSVPSYKNASVYDRIYEEESLIERIVAKGTGWKLAIFQLLFNDFNLDGLDNQIFTGGGDVVLIDHKYADPFSAAIPCFIVELWEHIVDSFAPATHLRKLYEEGNYVEFSELVFDSTGYLVRIFEDGTFFAPSMPYFHLLAAKAALPDAIRQQLLWILDHRSLTTPVLHRYFKKLAETKGRDVSTTVEIGTCLFYERIAWVAANQRLPTEAEGAAIVATCQNEAFPSEQWDCKSLTWKQR